MVYKSHEITDNKVEEPMALYALPITLLASMHPVDLDETHLPGSALLNVQKETSLSAQTLADVMGIGKSKFYDLVKSDDLGAKNIDALADLANLWQKGLEAFDGNTEHLNEWLNSKNINLGNILPVELFSSRIGRRELEKAFMRIEHSTYG